ncbi:MAG TPA: SDR family NAD(P)-dependent oxidoreductase, partial [Chryseolinea sp.]|nr:SDR family NAD(P)-dependent oxidoreductase [Chryseolinea sp.]
MLLKNKNAVIYGAAGSLGGAISQAFAKAGATVYVTGHKLEPVRKLAAEIIAAGGKAVASEVDALDERAVKDNLDAIVSKAGT